MWGIFPQSGITTTVLDFTNDLSLLTISLIGLTWLSAGMIVAMALKHYLLQKKTLSTEKMVPSPEDHRDAA